MARSEVIPEMHVDTLDDVTQVGPMLDLYQDIEAKIIDSDFQKDLAREIMRDEKNSEPSLDDPFGLTQWVEGDMMAQPLNDQSVESVPIKQGRMPSPEALFRANFFAMELATWIFQTQSEVTPEAIKRVIGGLLQNTPLPPEMLRTHPEVDRFSEKKKIKACLRFSERVKPDKIFLPCEIAGAITQDAYRIYQSLMQDAADGKIPDILGGTKTALVNEFANQLTGFVVIEAIRVSVKVDQIIMPKLLGPGVLTPAQLSEFSEKIAEGSLRRTMHQEGRKGLSAETVQLVLKSLHENITRFNSYVEYLSAQQAADIVAASEQVKVLLCSYVWALWHVSGTSVLEAEEHVERSNIALTQERQEDLMILRLLELSFEDFKQSWSVLAEKIKKNTAWKKTYANPAEVRKTLLRKLKAAKQFKDQIDQDLKFKELIEQQEALNSELMRLKRMDRDWQMVERQGGLEAQLRKVRGKTAHLNAKDLELFDLLAAMTELHPHCKVKVKTDMADSDFNQIMQVLSQEALDEVLKKRVNSVELQLSKALEEVGHRMPEGIVSYQQLISDIKSVERDIRLAEFVYGVSFAKTFDADQADLNFKVNQSAIVQRVKEMHAERLAMNRRKKKAETEVGDASA